MLRLKLPNPRPTYTFSTMQPEVYVQTSTPRFIVKQKYGYCRRCRVTMELDFGSCTVCLRPLSRL